MTGGGWALIGVGIAFVIVAAALLIVGWLINSLDRRVTALKEASRLADARHATLVSETRQAFAGWAAASDRRN